ncbi:hypothetical protein A8F94_08475 [Bacillus sp. FJAT-27225]|uniref:UDP-N-acetylglucosamine 2-epimerase n=1 Tax=Bacillus sp. FJAT-27225 TaxID=1743144 RepID=UPI00080C267B|nr:UDP-N-acetylglucosamine 2-epimerase [Bacillus sp. FJAT-27225]OCA87864.1 hypothetical protein A8F94_08475 [Bacillus sp. FJAT-27225]
MKVFFIAQYKYLHYQPYLRVIKELRRKGIRGYFVNLKNMNFVTKYDEEKYNKSLFIHDGVPFKEVELFANEFSNSFLLHRFFLPYLLKKRKLAAIRFLQISLSRWKLYGFFFVQRPKLIVIGSDLGGVYIRIIQDCCRKLNIKVLILNTHPNRPNMKDAEYSIPTRRLQLIRKFNLEKTLYFPKRTIGSYLPNSAVAVPGKVVKEHLVKQGISPDRIFITGNPVHDGVYELVANKKINITKEKERHGLDVSKKLIVYFSSLANEKYGAEYLDSLNTLIHKEWEGSGSQLIIKFHPREDDESKQIYVNTFGTQHVKYEANEFDSILLMAMADIVITDTGSSILPQAMLLRKRCLVLNLMKDNTPYKIPDAFLASSEDELLDKFRRLLEEDDGPDPELLDSVVKENFHLFDGKSSERCAKLIAELGLRKGF